MNFKAFLLFLLFSTITSYTQESKTMAYSGMTWHLDYDQALEEAAEAKKPVIIMFQGAIGCISCQNFGMHIISHPLMAEAITDHFIPLIVFDKARGDGKMILEHLGDNKNTTPDMRIINSLGEDVIKATTNDYNYSSFSGAIIKALESYNTSIPPYLELLHQDFINKDSQTPTKTLVSNIDSLRSSPYLFLPMAGPQQNKVSQALTSGQDPMEFLSPRQQEALEFISSHSTIDWEEQIKIRDYTRAWEKFIKKVNANQQQ